MSNKQGFTPSLAGLFLGLVLAYALWLPLLSGDLGWHIRVGQYLLDRGEVPRLNFLTFTAPWHIWLTHEWLAGAIFACLDDLGGLRALKLAGSLCFFATMLMLYRLGRRLEAEPLALAGLLLFTALTLALHISLRPWLFSNLLLVAELMLVNRLVRTPGDARFLWLFPPLLGLWINLHGGYIVGVALFLAALPAWILRPRADGAPARRLRRLATAAGAILMTLWALLLNPHAGEALVLPFSYLYGDQSSGLALTGEIREWAPIDLESFFGRVYLAWIGLALLAAARCRAVRRRPEMALGVVFLVLTFQAQRHLPIAALFLFPMVCTGLLAPLATRLEQAVTPRGRFLAALSAREGLSRRPFIALTTAVLVGAFLISSRSPDFEASRMRTKAYPLEAVAALAAQTPGRLYNHYDWAGLIAWKAPAWPLFITPVNDAYPRTLFEDWLKIANLKPGWQALLTRYQVDTVLMPTQSALAGVLCQDPAWQVGYQDAGATLLRRRQLEPPSGTISAPEPGAPPISSPQAPPPPQLEAPPPPG